MLRLPSGALLINTPGMRELQIWGAEESADETFADIATLTNQCQFRDCSHQSEPGCAIQADLEMGTLSEKRFNSYQQLQREAAYQHRR